MQSENLTLLEKEEREKMIKEFKEGIEKSNLSLGEMAFLEAIQVSKETASREENNKRKQKQDSSSPSNNFVSDVTSKAESINKTENERPKPSCSYTVPQDNNLELLNVIDKKNIYRKKSLDDDCNDNFQKIKNSKQEYYNQRQKNKLEMQKKLNRWKINPLDCHSDENDIPLQQPARYPTQERIPFGLCKDAFTIEKGNKIISEISTHLKEMADLWLSSHGSTHSKFQWGTPIQVDTANNSLDRKSLAVASNSNEVGNTKSNYDRTCKRKASWFNNTASSSSSSDDNDEISLSFLKRKRTEDAKIISKASHRKEQANEDMDHSKRELNKKDLFPENTNVDDKEIDCQNFNVKSPQESNKRVSPEIVTNPRRITPLKSYVLDTKKTQSSHFIGQNNKDLHNKDLERSPVTSRRKHINSTLTNKDIIKELEKNSDENNEGILNDDVVIKPLPMKNLSVRLIKQCALLKQAGDERKKKILIEQEEIQRNKEEEKEIKKQEFIAKRIQEIEKTYEEIEEMQKKEKNRLPEILQSRSKNHMQRWKEQKRRETDRQQKEASFQNCDNVRLIEEMAKADNCIEKKITCPICNKSFPSDRIENHAAMCEQFETDSEHEQNSIYSPQNSKNVIKEKTKKSKAIYECNICSSFKTNNGIDYEDHVNRCIQHKQNSPSREYTPITINIPDSPVRSYQPISEQRNSNIDYSGQLSSVSKAQVGRKRKR